MAIYFIEAEDEPDYSRCVEAPTVAEAAGLFTQWLVEEFGCQPIDAPNIASVVLVSGQDALRRGPG